MIQDLAGQVLAVTSRQSRDGTKTMYDVAFSDGNAYTTFDVNLAQKAQSLQGQIVTARVEVKPNPRGGNPYKNINDIAPQGQLPPLAQPLGAASGGITSFQPTGTAIQPAQPLQPIQPSGVDPDSGRRNAFAAQTAFLFMASLYQGTGPEGLKEAVGLARRLTHELVEFAAKGTFGGVQVTQTLSEQQGVPAQVPATPEAVAAFVGNGVQVGVDGIVTPQPPVAPAPQPSGDPIPW